MVPVDRRGVRAMRRFLLEDEQVVAASRQHWASFAGTVAGTVLGLVCVLAISFATPASLGVLSDSAWWIWFAMLAFTALKMLAWNHDWFVATDRRLLLGYGLINRKVDMMPMAKVTDLSFERSPVGRVLGFGTFVLESAGQDQALHEITYLPHPNETYRAICEELFGNRDDDEDGSQRVFDRGRNDDGAPAAQFGDELGAPDDTDVPLHRLGAYLDPMRPPRGERGHRIVRGRHDPRADNSRSDDQLSWGDAAGWTVSNEHAAEPQRVDRRDRRR